VLLLVARDVGELYLLGPSEWALPEDGDRIQSVNRRALNKTKASINLFGLLDVCCN
jgi:hypothetical protein